MRLFSDVSSHIDDPWLRRAWILAESGRGTTSPNPLVGCVIVRDGEIVGEGYHERAGGSHAEVAALDAAGAATRGATAYVTLEPCTHHGRTPPCVDALIASGVERVVVGIRDPNASVSGGGVEALRAAGVDVRLADDPTPFAMQNEAWLASLAAQTPVRAREGRSLARRTSGARGRTAFVHHGSVGRSRHPTAAGARGCGHGRRCDGGGRRPGAHGSRTLRNSCEPPASASRPRPGVAALRGSPGLRRRCRANARDRARPAGTTCAGDVSAGRRDRRIRRYGRACGRAYERSRRRDRRFAGRTRSSAVHRAMGSRPHRRADHRACWRDGERQRTRSLPRGPRHRFRRARGSAPLHDADRMRP